MEINFENQNKLRTWTFSVYKQGTSFSNNKIQQFWDRQPKEASFEFIMLY